MDVRGDESDQMLCYSFMDILSILEIFGCHHHHHHYRWFLMIHLESPGIILYTDLSERLCLVILE